MLLNGVNIDMLFVSIGEILIYWVCILLLSWFLELFGIINIFCFLKLFFYVFF